MPVWMRLLFEKPSTPSHVAEYQADVDPRRNPKRPPLVDDAPGVTVGTVQAPLIVVNAPVSA